LPRTRLLLLASSCLLPLLPGLAPAQSLPVARQPGGAAGPRAAAPPRSAANTPASTLGVIRSVRVVGNQRIETGSIVSRLSLGPGDPFDRNRIDLSLKTLYATGLFSDVKIGRDGDTLVVSVVENPLINRVVFEGNHALTDDALRAVVQLKPRAVFTAAQAEADRQRILAAYAKRSRYAATVEPKIIRLDQNRVDVVFEIVDGPETLTSRIAFVGNHAFSEGRLREVIASREEAFWRILGTTDSYDAERVNYDKELLRRFYLKNGYVDFRVVDATAELAPDRSGFFLTFVIDEGPRYRLGKVKIESRIKGVSPDSLKSFLDVEEGDWYDGDAVERTTTALAAEVRKRGWAFVEVNPRIARNTKDHTVDLVFDVVEGPRVYIERIDINGNTRTKDKVIRREFLLSEGDAFNAELLRQTRQRLRDTGFFSNATIATSQGSAPDRVIVNTNVEEKATG
jgi:outer membrane protein insertion porin family